MNLPRILLFVAIVILLLFNATQATAQGSAPTVPQAPINQGFTYQGQLKNTSGSPLTSSCNIQFSLWNALTAGNQIGAISTASGVSVSGGFFIAQVNAGGEFGWNALNGSDRWLQITVQCSGDAGFTALSPRQALAAAPYAIGLRPGTAVIGNEEGGPVIYGENTSIFPGTSGLLGKSLSQEGSGVYGWASATSGANHGVTGVSYSSDGYAVFGIASSNTGANYGVYGKSFSTEGYGAYGYASATSGATRGVEGRSDSTGGTGVSGWATASTGYTNGVYGTSWSTDGTGVYGYANATSGLNYGVWGKSNSPDGYGLFGFAAATTGPAFGVLGISNSPDGHGVAGYANAISGTTYGLEGRSKSPDGYGVYGTNNSTSGAAYGVYGESLSTAGYGVFGIATATSGKTYGVFGESAATEGFGVFGYANAASGVNHAVWGQSDSTDGRGVLGYASATSGTTYGVVGWVQSPDGYAGRFDGNVEIFGTLSKSAGNFKIDHPLDPANQYLSHSFVESPDMLNIYTGQVLLDTSGQAWVQMPAWFQALNGGAEFASDYRYQLTPIGAAMPGLYISQEIQSNRFQISGGAPGRKVSWEVTGIRHDPYAEAHRIPVEQAKPAGEQGTYLFPELYGQPADLGLDYQKNVSLSNPQPKVSQP